MKFNKQFSIYFLIFSIVILSGCSSSRLGRSGRSSYEIGEYNESISKLQKAVRKEKDPVKRQEMNTIIADAYWKIGNYKSAERKYKGFIKAAIKDSTQQIYIRHAECLRNLGKFDDAIKVYERYLDSIPGDQRALNGIACCKQFDEFEKNPTRHQVKNEKYLNSRDADFSPVFIGTLENTIILTSTRDGAYGKKRSPITGQRYADLFRADYDMKKSRWGKPTPIDDQQILNTTDDEGAASISSDGQKMYFTRCRFDKKAAIGAEVFVATRSKNNWSEPTEIAIIGDSLIMAHPSISADNQTLYFVSDMGDGYGGKDIWKVEQLSGEWGAPKNLGPEINTPGNEVFPHIRDNGELYFSSDFHIGMGGLDIFKATFEGDDETGKWIVKNMGSPINSNGDDFSISFLQGKDKGMFASNRKGSSGDDIYSILLPPKIFRAEGIIVNGESSIRENNAFLRIIGTDGTMLKVRSTDGKFQHRLNPDTEYIFACFKDGFLNDKKLISTNDLLDSKTFNIQLKLTPTDIPIKVDNVNYETNKWQLLPSSISALDSLIEMLDINPTVVIEIMAHTDHTASHAYNSQLSQRRAQSAVDYLISKGVNPKRLIAKGYGETWPKTVTRQLAEKYEFLKRNDELNETFIQSLETKEQQEIAKAINRRTEFRVISTDFREEY